ncbi:hypothetical protein NDN08_003557 [Rhodosorus marinus]|uniref:Calcineurin-like phosphoesterase domain-containing protein n=1 Tax=Rhodosorus marinus TaxID=101924 RepID=A0AAV8UXU5_9RHOD|nr:hypothetical protein NDN08_003557 [Rhodosorus marinus]
MMGFVEGSVCNWRVSRRPKSRVCDRVHDEDSRSTRRVKLVHWTDVHFFVPDGVKVLPERKELLGLLNLYVMGREKEFNPEKLVSRLVDDVAALNPDVVVFSGDMSAMGTSVEFETALRVIKPMLAAFPSVLIAGNHDRYTQQGRDRMETYFGQWMAGGIAEGALWSNFETADESWPGLFKLQNGLRIITLDQARPSVASNGAHSRGQISRLRSTLQREGPQNCIIVGHYPILDPWLSSGRQPRNGSVPLYDRLGRSLKDVNELHAALLAHPPLAYLCGHHHAQSIVRSSQGNSDRSLLQICCGSSAYVGHKDKNWAGFYEIDLEPSSGGFEIADIHRHVWSNQTQRFLRQTSSEADLHSVLTIAPETQG